MKGLLTNIAVALAIFGTETAARKMTVKNNCGFTIWCVAFSKQLLR